MKNSAIPILIALVVGGGLASPAAGQGSTTRCQTDYFGNITCQTTQDPNINWQILRSPQPNAGDAFLRGWQDAEARRNRTQNTIAPPPPRYRPADEQTLRQVCAEEFAKALESGDEEQAESIKRVCSPKP